MAGEEFDREDLLREATALVERIELVSDSGPLAGEPIVIGFRANGAVSIFFGADPVYQFNAAGELRRAYADGLLYTADRGRLVSFQRVRTPEEVQLQRNELSDSEQAAFLARMRDDLARLWAQLQGRRLRASGQVPPQTDVLARVESWLGRHEDPPIAASPRVR
jgi:hypothetical protein